MDVGRLSSGGRLPARGFEGGLPGRILDCDSIERNRKEFPMPQPFFRGTDADLATGATNLISIVTAVPATWGLTSGIVTSYTTLSTSYNSLLTAATTPATRTPVAIQAKNAAGKLLKASSVNIAKIITATPTVTNAQLLSLRLNMRATPTPSPVPATAPNLDIVSVSGFTSSIRLHDSTSGSRRGKPVGVAGASVFSHVGAAAPTEMSGWTFEGNTGKTRLNLSFSGSNAAGTTVWFSAFWFNGAKQSGPMCAPVSTNLPGGSVAMAA